MIRFLFFLLWLGLNTMAYSQNDFIEVRQTQFFLKGKPYYFLGTNFWYGMNLGSLGQAGDRERLVRELDRLAELGINNLRIMAASEGPDTEPWRMIPALQPQKGVYNEDLLTGLDFLLAEMAQRKMHAVVCLNNFWPWSGGMAQYLAWENGDSIPYPPPAPRGNWNRYQNYAAGFYQNEAALQAYEAHLRNLITRTNSLTQQAYRDDPTIMAWQLANEPRGMQVAEAYIAWVGRTAQFIKQLDPHHLVSVGSEGTTPAPLYAGTRFNQIHQIPEIDYATFHIWVQNWAWYQPRQHRLTFGRAKRKARAYLNRHIKLAAELGKPAVLEEFGIARDENSHDPATTTLARDAYYAYMFGLVHRAARKGEALVGCNFWAWGGEGRPREPRAVWKAGDDFIGDPPHEHQGWYSVYEQDETTLAVIRAWAEKMNQLP